MIIQFRPRAETIKTILSEKEKKLRKLSEGRISYAYITNGSVIFFFISRSDYHWQKLFLILRSYSERYPELDFCVPGTLYQRWHDENEAGLMIPIGVDGTKSSKNKNIGGSSVKDFVRSRINIPPEIYTEIDDIMADIWNMSDRYVRENSFTDMVKNRLFEKKIDYTYDQVQEIIFCIFDYLIEKGHIKKTERRQGK